MRLCGRPTVVLGAGVAGASLARLLSRKSVGVKVYDISPRVYRKPCGEAVPAWLPSFASSRGLPAPPVLEEVRRFAFYTSSMRRVVDVEFGEAPWVIIDKERWVRCLRSGLEVAKPPPRSPRGLLVDARGPYSSRGLKVVVWQAYLENTWGIHGSSLQVLEWGRSPGLVWCFSRGDLLNVGGGFVGVARPRGRSIELLERLLGGGVEGRILSESHSLVTMYPEIRLYDGRCSVRVGEAAGLVMSLGGEGIRPALLSALALSESISLAGDHLVLDDGGYEKRLEPLRVQVRLQRLLFRLAAGMSEEMVAATLSRLDEHVLYEWLSGRLGLSGNLLGLLALLLKAG